MEKILSQLSDNLLKYLRKMDDEAETPSGYNGHAGLIDYLSFKGGVEGKYEDCWNNRLAELLKDDCITVSREFRYPNKSGKRCDIVIKNGDIEIWLETKAAWKCWFSSRTGKKEYTSNYKGYFYGNGKTHSIAHDIEKLNTLDSENADYVGLLVIGFDIAADPIDSDIEQLAEKMKLNEQGWGIYGNAIWPDRNHPDYRYNCWFLGKKVL